MLRLHTEIQQHLLSLIPAFQSSVKFKLKMERNMLVVFLLACSIGLALSNPVVRPNYDNIPQCLQPPESGLCLAYFPSYYYNPSKETCESFIYGGCRGNANRFLTFDDCMAKCGGFKPETDESFKLVLETDSQEGSQENQERSEENICFQPSVMGPCRAMMPRFYFAGDKCESFIYGGCQGNENNFKTVEECRQKCGTGSSEEVAESSEDNSEESSSKDSK